MKRETFHAEKPRAENHGISLMRPHETSNETSRPRSHDKKKTFLDSWPCTPG